MDKQQVRRIMMTSPNSIEKVLLALQDGIAITRAGWNGKGMFLYHVPKGAYKPCTKIAESLVNEEGLVEYDEYIALRTATSTVSPYCMSQEDIFATDWQVIGYEMYSRLTPVGSFSWAFKKLLEGNRLARKGWNGKGMFIYYKAGENIENAPNESNGKHKPYIEFKNAHGDITIWTPSNADLLSEDWEIVE